MSRRTSESSKAIAQAWKQEKQRVSEGNGTRDWTQEQQKDILDRGKAYDEDGRAFGGHHMCSAEKHPEFQGDPNNIQFLTYDEHFDAHDRDWRNPTNWYYDPVTKTKFDFGDGPIIPCKAFELSNPICLPGQSQNEVKSAEHDTNAECEDESVEKPMEDSPPSNVEESEGEPKEDISPESTKESLVEKFPSDDGGEPVHEPIENSSDEGEEPSKEPIVHDSLETMEESVKKSAKNGQPKTRETSFKKAFEDIMSDADKISKQSTNNTHAYSSYKKASQCEKSRGFFQKVFDGITGFYNQHKEVINTVGSIVVSVGFEAAKEYITHGAGSAGGKSAVGSDSSVNHVHTVSTEHPKPTSPSANISAPTNSKVSETSNRNYPATHASPQENTVPAHRQRYHTKDGNVVWRDKKEYKRGGKKDDS